MARRRGSATLAALLLLGVLIPGVWSANSSEGGHEHPAPAGKLPAAAAVGAANPKGKTFPAAALISSTSGHPLPTSTQQAQAEALPVPPGNHLLTPMDENVNLLWDKIHFNALEEDHMFPMNVSGMYRGTWSKVSYFQELEDIHLLRKPEGVVIFELRTVQSEEKGLHTVEGDLVIRDGEYVTDNDVRMRLHGVYVPDASRLDGILEPLMPVRVGVSEQDQAEGNAQYRHALRDAAKDWSVGGMRRPIMVRDVLPGGQLKMKKTCEFRVELKAGLFTPQPPHGTANEAEGSLKHTRTSARGSSWEASARYGIKSPEEVALSVADLIMNGTIVSDNCGLVISVNATYVRLEEYYAKAVNYTLMITIVSFVQVLLLIRQMECTNTQASASKVSLMSIGMQAIMDAYLCLLHLTAGIVVEALFNAFATAAFFEFVIFAIFEMRYLLSIWRARRSGNSDNGGPRRELSILYTRFYGVLLVVIFFAYQLQRYMRSLMFLLFSFWIPQIVHCIRADVRQPLRPMYILGVSATRLALPLYLYGCPKNMLRISTSPTLCLTLIGWVSLQALVLLLQGRFGPRCFIPKRFLPAKYDYFRIGTPFAGGEQEAGDLESGEGATECVICMTPVEVKMSPARMVTPCNHFFHTSCLERWMDVKMECPTCRRVLPPP